MSLSVLEPIAAELIKESMTYASYKAYMKSLIDQGNAAGTEEGSKMLAYTVLNQQRMHRVEKTCVLEPGLLEQLLGLEKPVIWLVLTEPWCGDAATAIPVMNAMAAASPKIKLQLLLRDVHPELMNRFLTNGSRSIPKLIALDPESLVARYTWGPRPQPAQALMQAYKANPARQPYADFVASLQLWYAKDKTRSMQREFLNLLS